MPNATKHELPDIGIYQMHEILGAFLIMPVVIVFLFAFSKIKLTFLVKKKREK